ncbi:MAG: type I glyceraldehyde-3-phosphate dehydrogenase [Bacteroidota bacterium]
MAKRIAINGFGRIGRLTLRNLLKRRGVEVVAINDLTDNATLAHLFKYDSAQGAYQGRVSASDDHITIDRKKIVALTERDPSKCPWKKLKVDVVLECTGIFRTLDKASMHISAGAKKVVLSAPAKSDGIQTIVLGVNDETLDPKLKVFSNASCTTNCLAPVVKVIADNYGFVQGSMTTTHAYTSDQRIQDAPHSDLRRARAAAFNIVPTSTGAASAVGKVLPEVQGKLNAMALRVPTITGSLIELNCIIEKDVTAEQVNRKFKSMARGAMKGVLEYQEDPIVSSDIVGNPHSSIFDSKLTQVSGKMLKVVSWYDNEAGYSARLADLTVRLASAPARTTRRKAAAKTTTRKATTRKTTAKKAATPAAAKKTTTRKAATTAKAKTTTAAKKATTTTKKAAASAGKTTTRKTTTRKTTARKTTPAKTTAAKATTAKKAAPKKATPKKAAPKRVAAKKDTTKAAANGTVKA